MEFDPPSQGDRLDAIFVAVDGGARAALEHVAACGGSALHDVSSDAAESCGYWSGLLEAAKPAALVVGTSDSERGRRVEARARRAARSAALPIVAIEDFPGNYAHVASGEATAVIVESAAAADLCTRKLGACAPPLVVAAPARYDPYRSRIDELRRHTAQQWALDPARSSTVLWAGQPETEDCLHTLAALLPALRHLNADVAFKAHPRDAGYLAGAYRRVFDAAGVRYRDVTASSVHDVLAAAPRLVVTQFSSLAIEAGFFGIPSLWVLLPEAGAARLKEKKGYEMPALALAGGAWAVTDTPALRAACARSLDDEDARANLMRAFDAYFDVRHRAAAATLETLSALVRSQTKSQIIMKFV